MRITLCAASIVGWIGWSACGDGGSAGDAACSGAKVLDGTACVLSAPITETGFECPPEMPFQFQGGEGNDRWMMCSSNENLDAEAIDQALREAGEGDETPDEESPDPDEPVIVSDDVDGDGVVDRSDNCVRVANGDQADSDRDGVGDACEGEPVVEPADDRDGDGYQDISDNCPDDFNPMQTDSGGDAAGDACDCGGSWCSAAPWGTACTLGESCISGVCAGSSAEATSGICTDYCSEFGRCPEGSECKLAEGDIPVCFPDGSEPVTDPDTDTDGDGILDGADNCPSNTNGDQADVDHDGLGDACDDCTDANSDRICDEDQR